MASHMDGRNEKPREKGQSKQVTPVNGPPSGSTAVRMREIHAICFKTTEKHSKKWAKSFAVC
jgi:hypothetical protein